jgi:hypothetical protein
LLQIIAKRGNTLWVPKTKNSISNAMMAGFENAKISGSKYTLSLCATISSTYSSIFSKNIVYDGVDNKFNTMSSLMMLAIGAYVSRNK